ncbi:HAD-IA family hydrolase [Fructilactobacillus florum]|uniref:HAD-IA family hydrolase n=1 Tax=Fructilactobacillus florum TaxID=640331 RepID=UPI00028C9028|nr:HAD-IA family hydrolase [Fructilactobacillus florum]EKK20202.1 hydrolase, haloacid dehalogenase-like family [Fructilactobacillus florum 2F]
MHNLIWDFDGTLFDTYPAMVTAFAKALAQNGIDEIEIDAEQIYQQLRVHSLASALQRFSAEFKLSITELSASYHKWEQLEIKLAKPMPHSHEVLKLVTSEGGENELETHRDQQSIELLTTAKMISEFSGVVTSQQGFARKPSPAGILYLLQHSKLQRENTAMIGDRKLDILAGQRAGLQTILFDKDYLITDDGHPDVIIRDLSELKPLLAGH